MMNWSKSRGEDPAFFVSVKCYAEILQLCFAFFEQTKPGTHNFTRAGVTTFCNLHRKHLYETVIQGH